MGGKFKAK